MLLYPDQRVTQQPDNDTCVFAAPIESTEWAHLYARGARNELQHTGMRYVIFKDSIHEGDNTSVYFMRNDAEITDQVCVLLRGTEDPDTCIESAAWIRINENYPGMIYIVPYTLDPGKYQTHHASLGAPEELVCMVDYDVIEE